MGEKKKADFRYDTGAARIPWAAVGEIIRSEDILQIVRFLVPPAQGDESAYADALRQVRQSLDILQQFGGPATKLTLGDHVKNLEQRAAGFLGVKHACFMTNGQNQKR